MEMKIEDFYSNGYGSYSNNLVFSKRVAGKKRSLGFDLMNDYDPEFIDINNQFYEFRTRRTIDKMGFQRGPTIRTATPLVKFERIK